MLRLTALLFVTVAFPLAAQPDQAVMFRGNPAHTGVVAGRIFSGQGGIRWQTRIGNEIRSSPAVHGDRIFAGSGDGFLYAFDRRDGRILWKHELGSPVHSSPAVSRGLVIVGSLNGRVAAVDERTGRLRWSAETGPEIPANIHGPMAYEYFLGSPVVSGSSVVIGGRDGGIHALELTSGKRRWRVATGGRVSATPAIVDSTVVVGSFDGVLYALDLGTGRQRWAFRTQGASNDVAKAGYDVKGIQSSPAIVGGLVFFGARDAWLYAVDLKTGEQRWRLSHDGSWVVGSPAVDDRGRLFVGSSDGRFLQSVDVATGKELWRLPTAANVQSSPVLVGDLVLAGLYRSTDATGGLIAVDAATGKVRWRLQLDRGVISTPAVVDGEIYLGTDGGSMMAIHEVAPAPARLAVFYDSTSPGSPYVTGLRLAFEYFRGLGYQPLGPDSLAAFLADRIADGAPSVVVYASDRTPADLLAGGNRSPLRRYLEAGGKLVSFGLPPGMLVRDSTGKPIAFDYPGVSTMLDIPLREHDYNELPGFPTDVGRQWGVDQWIQGKGAAPPSATLIPLNRDVYGNANAWAKVYRTDRPGSGFVHLWGMGATLERLPMIRAVAEYGLVR